MPLMRQSSFMLCCNWPKMWIWILCPWCWRVRCVLVWMIFTEGIRLSFWARVLACFVDLPPLGLVWFWQSQVLFQSTTMLTSGTFLDKAISILTWALWHCSPFMPNHRVFQNEHPLWQPHHRRKKSLWVMLTR